MRNGGLVGYTLPIQPNGIQRSSLMDGDVRNSIVGRSGSSLRLPHFENEFESVQPVDAGVSKGCSGTEAGTPASEGVEDLPSGVADAEAANETQSAPMAATVLRVFRVTSRRVTVASSIK